MKLTINTFKSLSNLSFSIPVQITGGNGLGKTTILEAISFVLTGKDLSGNEFKQVYDNRVDIYDAIADVSYFDNYGNEFQRIVQPIFQTNHAGIEEIKIKRSTECRKNGIPCNDFSDEFQDFYKFGTDYFFNQKEDLQRSIFIEILKSKLPDYDVNSASLKLKELKKSQKIEVDMVKGLQDANKNTKDVSVPEISTDIEKLNAEYITKSESFNPELVKDINIKNNLLMSGYFSNKRRLEIDLSNVNFNTDKANRLIESETELLQITKNQTFTPKATEPTDQLQAQIDTLSDKLETLEYFDSIEHYAALYFTNNPVLVENQKKIVEIQNRVFVFSGEECGCPLNKQECPISKTSSEKTELWVFNSENEIEIKQYKAQNRSILEKEMNSTNSEYNAVKSDLQEAERKLNRVIEFNSQVDRANEIDKLSFETHNAGKISIFNSKIIDLNTELSKLSTQLTDKQTELSNLVEPAPEKLPETVDISEELKQARSDYLMMEKDIIGARAINENNAQLKSDRAKEIKEKQAHLLQIIEQITALTTAISDYFSSLTNIVKQEFAGDIEINVELLEYVMSRDEYKDTFKITANGKTFPFECNGSLQNNVKLQILFNLQRLKGYNGVTLMDNCESNTSNPINSLGLNCVLAYATHDKELIIINQ